MKHIRLHKTLAGFALALLLVPVLATAQSTDRQPPRVNEKTVILPAPAADCAALDDPARRNRMDGLLFNLLWSCGRQHEIVQAPQAESFGETAESLTEALLAVDAQVNNSAGETGTSTTQSETSITRSTVTGTLCAAFNDSCEYFCPGHGGGFTGFARSTDGGGTWQDGGAVGSTSMGDPSLTWRRADGYFYIATLESGGALSVWRSTNDCQSFSKVSVPSTGSDDKEILTADNNPASPYYGYLYMVWTDFGVSGTPIRAMRSTDAGVTWSTPVNLSAAGTVQGAWPAVAPNGDVYVAWLRYASWPSGNITVEMARSTNGGLSYTAVTSPLSNAISPRDSAASSACGRPALNGNIRYLASPQITVTSNGVLHVIYAYDPDGFGAGDVVNVYYRRSTDNGATWSAQVQLNDVATNDQYFGTIQADGLRLVAGWYDRRNDGGNLRQDYYKRVSTDAGLTWGANVRVTDVNSPIQLDPNLATCYHGDYDQSAVLGSGEVMQWADDRNFVGTRNDPDVWSDAASAPAPDFSVSVSPASLSIAQNTSGSSTVTVTALNGWTAPVTLSVSGVPSGVTASFSVNPVTPTANSILTLAVSCSAATGTYGLTVTGASGATVRTVPLTLTVTPGSCGCPSSTATYDAVYKAPRCSSVVASCDSGASLLLGRDTIAGGPEPNQPNTIFNSCADGTLGTFHADESNDRLKISTLGCTPFAPGATVRVEATVYAWAGSPSSDAVDLYYTDNATSPSWTYIATLVPTVGGTQVLSATYTLPVGALQAVRAVFRYGGSATGCGTGVFDDTDDLIFAVAPSDVAAAYDATLTAPKCTVVGKSCDSGAALVLGRDTIAGGPEPNQPNTISNSCADGTLGTFHADESNDRVKVQTLSGSAFAAGSTVRIDATVWAWAGSPTSDALDLYYAANALAPVWTYITTLVPSVGGAQVLSATYTLPAGNLQAVRAAFRYVGAAASCTTGVFDDRDDLIFAVQ